MVSSLQYSRNCVEEEAERWLRAGDYRLPGNSAFLTKDFNTHELIEPVTECTGLVQGVSQMLRGEVNTSPHSSPKSYLQLITSHRVSSCDGEHHV